MDRLRYQTNSESRANPAHPIKSRGAIQSILGTGSSTPIRSLVCCSQPCSQCLKLGARTSYLVPKQCRDAEGLSGKAWFGPIRPLADRRDVHRTSSVGL